LVTDNDGINDSDTNPGIVGISGAPFDDYLIEMISVPTNFDVTLNVTSVAIWGADTNPLMTFTLISQTADVSELDPFVVTTAPLLNSTHAQTLSGFNAVIVNQTESSVDSTSDLPEIIGVGQNNTNNHHCSRNFRNFYSKYYWNANIRITI
jgi:hypothetical protein